MHTRTSNHHPIPHHFLLHTPPRHLLRAHRNSNYIPSACLNGVSTKGTPLENIRSIQAVGVLLSNGCIFTSVISRSLPCVTNLRNEQHGPKISSPVIEAGLSIRKITALMVGRFFGSRSNNSRTRTTRRVRGSPLGLCTGASHDSRESRFAW